MFKSELELVPHLPGSYQMYNDENIIIYVGKAKDLKKRLTSYFKGNVNNKTAKLVSEIAYFKYIVTSSELESLILEINLIKKYNPKYNIMLKDDKSYPYIEYISKPYPKLKVSRYLSIRKKDHKHLFGPYPNAYAARRLVNLLNRLYPLKKCDNMQKKVCLYYHINECLGYCDKSINKDKVTEMENEILSFLGGNSDILIKKISDKINSYSNDLNYEMALELKEEMDYIKVILEKQKVELADLINRDIINYYFENGYLSMQIFFIRNGKMIGSNNDIFPTVDDYLEEVEWYVANFYLKHEIPREIIINGDVNLDLMTSFINTKVTTVTKGKKKKLLDLAALNAKINLNNKFELIKKDERRTIDANKELQNLLGLNHLYRIDLFDNSNLFGSFSVSAMVVFKDGKKSVNDYRKYKISKEKNDDYNMMKEVIYRRYYKALLEKTELPDLIIVDGGINQIHACKDVLESLNLNIKVCGLKKDDKHKTNVLVDGNSLLDYNIDKTSNLFHYLSSLSEEVHRFTINYHRQLRSKGSISSILDNVSGIGDKRKKELIKKYHNISNIVNVSDEELSKIIPIKVVKELKDYLKEFSRSSGENAEENQD